MEFSIDLLLFTIGPLVVMTAAFAYTVHGAYHLSDYRPLLLVALLGLMMLHQVTELAEFSTLGFLEFRSRPAEAFESGANVLAGVASYAVVQHLGDLRATKTELDATNTALRERSTMVNVLHRILRHNVRNDVNIIGGHAENAAARVDDEVAIEELEIIERRAWGLATISDRTQRIKHLLSEEHNETKTFRFPEALQEPIETVLTDAQSATITLKRLECPGITARAASTFPSAVADVLAQIITHNDGSVAIEVRVSSEPSRTDDGRSIRIDINDDGDGLPDLDIQTIEIGDETPLMHAEGLALWCLLWTVKRTEGTINLGSGESTLEIFLPRASNGAVG
ncbi:hypothetical protein [Halorarius halobius]|uniref:hypothetical protein n=1 Tax=Halorarius halobius TaxID=2962671 RepID=UPI0020CB7E68|nr:hypothetical protein [Halorarius halobius]